MSVETEIKFLLSAPVARALSRDLFPAAVARADHLDTTYFDTPAGHLEAAKVAREIGRVRRRPRRRVRASAGAFGGGQVGECARVRVRAEAAKAAS
ncbi:MAG: hypothetical protein VXY81_10155, partial [Pseudomonadota bacterium]|nr:hypothetical protein [Pseudomonadota bacterium]